MIRFCRVLFLKCRVVMLEAQIDNGHALLADHKTRLERCYKELRYVQSQIGLLDSAKNLLMQALRRK